MGELLLLLAGATVRQAKMAPDPAMPQEQLAFALQLNALAEGCYPPDAGPRALWRQRGELTRLAGRAEEAQRLLEMADTVLLRTARDRYLLIADQSRQMGSTKSSRQVSDNDCATGPPASGHRQLIAAARDSLSLTKCPRCPPSYPPS